MNNDHEADSNSGTGMHAGWHRLIAVPTPYEAHLLEGFLESEGVRVQLESKFFSQDPLSTGALGNIHLWVPVEEAERAEKLLAEGRPDADEGDDASEDSTPE